MRVAMTRVKEEFEFTFVIDTDHLERLLRLLWPHNRMIHVDGVRLKLRKQEIKRAIHFYSLVPPAGDSRRRFKIVGLPHNLKGIIDQKAFQDEHKFEQKIRKYRHNMLAFGLAEFGEIRSALFKERAKLTFEFRRGFSAKFDPRSILKIGVDRIIAFDPTYPQRHGGDIFHIEFEADSAASQMFFCESDFFKGQVAHYLRAMTVDDAKWKIGSRYCGAPFVFPAGSESGIDQYVDDVIAALQSESHRLEPMAAPIMELALAKLDQT
jgi:hypothetical protein